MNNLLLLALRIFYYTFICVDICIISSWFVYFEQFIVDRDIVVLVGLLSQYNLGNNYSLFTAHVTHTQAWHFRIRESMDCLAEIDVSV